MSRLLGISVEDVQGNYVPNAEVVVRDLGSTAQTPLSHFRYSTEPGSSIQVFDLGNLTKLGIELKAPRYFGYTLTLEQTLIPDPSIPDPSRDPNRVDARYKVNARSPVWGLFTYPERAGTLYPSLRLVARRVRQAPRVVASSSPGSDVAPPIVDDPGGIWIDSNRQLEGLFDEKATGFPALLENGVLKDASSDNWDRFRATTVTVDPRQADGGNWFDWLEYGEPDGFRMLVAIWVVNRAGARADKKVDFLFFFCPRTEIAFFSPAHVYPYKRKRIDGTVVQPYSALGYRYLSSGSSPGSDFAIAYQAMASKCSLVVVMPLNAHGFWGPLLCQEGLYRLAREVATYVGDNTKNTPPPSSTPLSSTFAQSSRQSVNRIALSAYSAGAVDALKLFRIRTIAELADSYKSARDDKQAQDFAKRLAALTPSLWQFRAADFERQWAEFYSVDGFFGTNIDFPAECGPWFFGNADRILRVYATPGRMKSAADIISKRLADVFKGVTPNHVERTGNPTFSADEWHRSDRRASVVWFSEPYMTFRSVPFMPTEDDHHTIPRVVFSHAISQSKLLQL